MFYRRFFIQMPQWSRKPQKWTKINISDNIRDIKKAFDILFLTSKTTPTMVGIQVKGQILAFKGQI